MLKSTVLLAILLFLISAPVPDAQVMSQVTSNLLIDNKEAPLMAADAEQSQQATSSPPAESTTVEGESGREEISDSAATASIATSHSQEDLNSTAL
jgi:hypothetical protein